MSLLVTNLSSILGCGRYTDKIIILYKSSILVTDNFRELENPLNKGSGAIFLV